MANGQDSSLAARHMHIWGRAARAAGEYMSLRRQRQGQGQDDQELQETRAVLVAELAALLEVAQQLDRELPAWKRVFYVRATLNMLEMCGVTQREIDDFAAP